MDMFFFFHFYHHIFDRIPKRKPAKYICSELKRSLETWVDVPDLVFTGWMFVILMSYQPEIFEKNN